LTAGHETKKKKNRKMKNKPQKTTPTEKRKENLEVGEKLELIP